MHDPKWRHVGDGRQLVIAQVRGPHAAIFQREVLHEGHPEPVHEPTLELAAKGDRVDRLADVDREHRIGEAHGSSLAVDERLDRMDAGAVVDGCRIERGRDVDGLAVPQ